MGMFIHSQVLCDAVAGRKDHILRTPKRLQAAVSSRSAGGKAPPFTPLLASFCRIGAISIILVSPDPRSIYEQFASPICPFMSAQSRHFLLSFSPLVGLLTVLAAIVMTIPAMRQ
ncbi:hypothetical protein [Phyllobacterium myrsinacearum]|uniref:hypothetical protein n=1 Tax=Phyllobacterium myrsinacearum TaxID=28101 RepID=UPI0010297266|nr:hypothetical protein [Phyllobacterium myrsinacearum]